MNLSPLPPDVRFDLLPRSDEAFDFSFGAKRCALGPYIIERWGWDAAYQQQTHRKNFNEKPFFQIIYQDHQAGTLSVMASDDYIRFGEFYLFPAYQGKGLGTRILRHCFSLADALGLPIRLEYLKWNPVGTLYRRNGFVVTGESEVHWFMESPFLS
ncbi:MAG: GNAT family N-acetyltransferase [Acidobacteriota bacterium]|nr:GNAT family N-acetyltransferase [Acidobacteriota bacterium]